MALGERRNWKLTYREWMRQLRIPKSPLNSRFNTVFGRGTCIARALEDPAGGLPRALGLSGWATVVHTADLHLGRAPSEGESLLRLRVTVQNASFGRGTLVKHRMSTAALDTAQATAPLSVSAWAMVPVLVSALGVRIRTRDGRVLLPAEAEEPPLIAVNSHKLVREPSHPPAPGNHHHFISSDSGACSCGKRHDAYPTPVGGVLDARDVLEGTPCQAAVVLHANDFAVMELSVLFPSDSADVEPEALEQLASLEMPVRRADGVGQSTTLQVNFESEAFIWDQYVHIPGGALCLKDQAASAIV